MCRGQRLSSATTLGAPLSNEPFATKSVSVGPVVAREHRLGRVVEPVGLVGDDLQPPVLVHPDEAAGARMVRRDPQRAVPLDGEAVRAEELRPLGQDRHRPGSTVMPDLHLDDPPRVVDGDQELVAPEGEAVRAQTVRIGPVARREARVLKPRSGGRGDSGARLESPDGAERAVRDVQLAVMEREAVREAVCRQRQHPARQPRWPRRGTRRAPGRPRTSPPRRRDALRRRR